MKKIALFGNPNTGKSSLFNRLTGLRQHVGNFPGVTVDKHSGFLTINGKELELIDFPGTYSIYPRSKDEEVVYNVISDPKNPNFPEKTIVVLDSTNLERNLLLFTQIYDLGLELALVLNMTDVASRNGFDINILALEQAFPAATIIRTNARIGTGLSELKEWMGTDSEPRRTNQSSLLAKTDIQGQIADTNKRFERIKPIVSQVVSRKQTEANFSNKLDKWLIHPLFGYLIFLAILLVIFQTVFTLASYPMDWIDMGTSSFASWLGTVMPEGIFTSLVIDGVIPGIGGVLIFIPQIALLFFMLAILEETGYMARVVFITDKLMRPFGLNGKSVVPLLSSAACAIPGIMATRTISSWQERLTTILVAPLISCSARLPVYTLLIGLVIPSKIVLGVLNLQGLVLFALYLLGVVSALLVAWVIKQFFRKKELSVFLLEMPDYKSPRWANVGIEVFEKVKIFVFDAGKIILAISIILWVLASFGPGNDMEKYSKLVKAPIIQSEEAVIDYETQVASVKLEHSYMGHMGKFIEPVITPLGYDWKMGISLIASFAAREVFVGSLATIYSVHDTDDDPKQLMDKLKVQKRDDGTPTYNLASGLSLLVFYVFAMQCMATLAVVKRETKSWKWPIVQVGYMGVLAYLGAYITYIIFK
ncbi:ferrous iron transporter B [Fluviicola taffensis]|uniref:Ferrous iron transport protein B n=1 Tax=Fluviicola taffensis (strain DSM 16823 / NCIMB 13979 / RW262) TaxID=755732 RepID=F2IF43_FLUTR|nr:ferrous iron transporter B [Fluviicola taffensis]AEA43517.1 ferrous iron transport protein B [Fluviicola taffensis DSM 16823]